MEPEEKLRLIPTIDYAKTILKQRLVYRRTAWGALGRICLNLMLFIPFILIAIICVQSFSEGGDTGLYFDSLAVIWLILSYINFNKIIKVSGINPIINKEDAITTLKSFYDDLTFDVSSDNILRDYRPQRFFKAGRVITVIFHENDVYFHKITLGKGDRMYPINGPIDYLKTKDIAAHFLHLQETRQKETSLPSLT